ncbi:hypothetical protein MUK42_07370, partial [Musa troglodytarum]
PPRLQLPRRRRPRPPLLHLPRVLPDLLWRRRLRHRGAAGGGAPLLRDHVGGAATVAGGDTTDLRRAPPARALQLPGLRPGTGLPDVGGHERGRHHLVPGGGSRVVRVGAQDLPDAAGAPRQVPDADGRGGQAAAGVSEGGGVPAGSRGWHIGATAERRVPAGAGGAAAGGVRAGVGRGDDRRSQGVLPVGAGADGGDLLGEGDGAGAAGGGRHRRVPPRRGSEGGEGVRAGVPLQEATGGRHRAAMALQDPAGESQRDHHRRDLLLICYFSHASFLYLLDLLSSCTARLLPAAVQAGRFCFEIDGLLPDLMDTNGL